MVTGATGEPLITQTLSIVVVAVRGGASCYTAAAGLNGHHTGELSHERSLSVRVFVRVAYLAACGRVMAPVTSLTPIAGLSYCVGRANTLSIVRVTVPTSVITGACCNEKRTANQKQDIQQVIITRFILFTTDAAVAMEIIVTPTAVVTLVSSHALHTLALPLLIT